MFKKQIIYSPEDSIKDESEIEYQILIIVFEFLIDDKKLFQNAIELYNKCKRLQKKKLKYFYLACIR